MIFTDQTWHDFFIMVGGAAAALTGLVFVAMSINLEAIAKDATHRHRAIGTLTGFTAAFAICAFVLMGGQNYQVVGLEWLTLSGIATAIYINGYIQAIKIGKSSIGLRTNRLTIGTSLYIAVFKFTFLKNLSLDCSNNLNPNSWLPQPWITIPPNSLVSILQTFKNLGYVGEMRQRWEEIKKLRIQENFYQTICL